MTMTTPHIGTPGRLVAASLLGALLLGCAHGSSTGPKAGTATPSTGSQSFAAFTITKSGGIAGIRLRTDVAKDGTVRNASGRVIGHIRPADLAELRSLLTGREIRAEAARSHTPDRSACADGFSFTLVMDDLRLSDYSCGGPDRKPAFSRVLELTSASRLQSS